MIAETRPTLFSRSSVVAGLLSFCALPSCSADDANVIGTGSSSGSASSGDAAPPFDSGPGDPSCGLGAAAFCDTFDAPSSNAGRAGELDKARWSGSRGEPQTPTGYGVAFGVGPATLPACRAGLPATVFPDSDTLVCDASEAIKSRHVLVAVGAQAFGQNSYRIRQPFDFTDRTGTIVFDAEGFLFSPLIGWISLSITEDPTPAPGLALPRHRREQRGLLGSSKRGRGALQRSVRRNRHAPVRPRPRRCPHRLQDAIVTPTRVCVATEEGRLNHFEIKVSKSTLEVYATPFSVDGETFAAKQLLYSGDIALPFSRGYVHITTHDHGALKFSVTNAYGAPKPIDAWIARWDNVGFDGPVVSNWREYEIADSLVPGAKGWDIDGPVMSVGYRVADAAQGPNTTLHFQNVDVSGVTSARLALVVWYDGNSGVPAQFLLRFRLNGGAWHDKALTAEELLMFSNGSTQGAFAQVMDVPVTDLVPGDNSLEFVTSNVKQDYPSAVSNVDLVLSK